MHAKRLRLGLVQARTSSSRLPGKVLLELAGRPSLEYQLQRLKRSRLVDRWVIATSTDPSDDAVAELAARIGVDVFRGSLDDVLGRFESCVRKYEAEGYQIPRVIRICGDCPLADASLLDRVIELAEREELDYCSNTLVPTYPDGMDVSTIARSALATAFAEARLPSEREHVVPYILKSDRFSKNFVRSETDYSSYRITLDEPEDYEVIRELASRLPEDAGYLDYIAYLDAHPTTRARNARFQRNEGYQRSLKLEQAAEKEKRNA